MNNQTPSTPVLHVGDARTVLATMPDASVDCIITSPPYWGKRDYDVAGQYGHEPSPAAYVETLRSVFHEARRVLASGTGTTGLAAIKLGRQFIGVELSSEFAKLAAERLADAERERQAPDGKP